MNITSKRRGASVLALLLQLSIAGCGGTPAAPPDAPAAASPTDAPAASTPASASPSGSASSAAAPASGASATDDVTEEEIAKARKKAWFAFQDPSAPSDPKAKLKIDAPKSAKAEKDNDGIEITAGPHFHLLILPGLASDISKDDRTKGYGLTNLKWETRAKTKIVYQATSRGKSTWYVETLVDVGDSRYDCYSKQSITEPEAFTHADIDAMLAACHSLTR